MWKDHFRGISEDYTFSSPASGDEIAKVESLFHVTLPKELK
ncbi:hypothetical protein ACQKFM_24615 [Paenibacillus xylanexedens]